MNDLISRQDAIKALARMMPHSYTPDGSHPADEEIFRAQEIFADCIEALEILPSADVQPVVRCKDCKYCDTGIDEDGNHFLKCLGWVYGGTKEDDYCSHGVRKG